MENTEKKTDKFTRKLGDKIEHTGDKISDLGAPGVGKKVREWGDKVEHSRDDKPSTYRP